MLSGPGPPSTGPYQQKGAGAAQGVERSLKGLRAGTVVDDVDAFTGQANDFLGESPLGVYDHMVCSGLSCHGDLVSGRDAADHVPASQLDDLGEQQSDASRRRMDQRDVAGLDGIEFGGEVAGSEPLHHHGSGRTIIDPVRNRHERVRRYHRPICVASRRVHPGNPLSGPEMLDSIARGEHPPGTLYAQNLGIGRFRLGHALADADVHEVHARRGDLDQNLSARGSSFGALDDFERIRSPVRFMTTAFIAISPWRHSRSAALRAQDSTPSPHAKHP